MIEKKHILLIEDSQTDVKFFTDALEASNVNFLCSIAKNCEQATRILRNIVPDIIFVDLQMTDNNITEFLENMNGLQSAHVVLYSTMASNKNITIAGQEPVNYLQLPKNVQTMANILQGFLNN